MTIFSSARFAADTPTTRAIIEPIAMVEASTRRVSAISPHQSARVMAPVQIRLGPEPSKRRKYSPTASAMGRLRLTTSHVLPRAMRRRCSKGLRGAEGRGGSRPPVFFVIRSCQIAGPVERGVLMTPVSFAASSAMIARSLKRSPISEATPVSASASSHLR